MTAPQTLGELMTRAEALSGQSLGHLAAHAEVPIPALPRSAKGFTGILIERLLGADAGQRPVPDFTRLETELKTVPVTADGAPLESTFVCVAPMTPGGALRFEDSLVHRKLKRVLWVPVETSPAHAISESVVRHPVLWSPGPEELASLRRDWEELTEMLLTGDADGITGDMGQVLQLRPKAANGRDYRPGFGRTGQPARRMALGFYLRPSFTSGILERAATGHV